MCHADKKKNSDARHWTFTTGLKGMAMPERNKNETMQQANMLSVHYSRQRGGSRTRRRSESTWRSMIIHHAVNTAQPKSGQRLGEPVGHAPSNDILVSTIRSAVQLRRRAWKSVVSAPSQHFMISRSSRLKACVVRATVFAAPIGDFEVSCSSCLDTSFG